MLRLDGRVRLAEDLSYDTRHPVILPKNHPVNALVIVDAHEKLGHGTGTEHLLTELRSQFWIVKGRLMVRTVVENCPECRWKFLAKPVGQRMVPLHASRIGTDFAGPVLYQTKASKIPDETISLLIHVFCGPCGTLRNGIFVGYGFIYKCIYMDDCKEGDALICDIR